MCKLDAGSGPETRLPLGVLSAFQKVFITPDQSQKEKATKKNFCMMNFSSGERDLMIRRGKIIKQTLTVEPHPPWGHYGHHSLKWVYVLMLILC